MKEFNLNHNILIQITEYGWKDLERYEDESGNYGFTKHCIKAYEQIIDREKWYKLQAHFVIGLFPYFSASSAAQIKPKILIPDNQ